MNEAERVAATYEKPPHGWTCFHCGATFTTPGAARDHFGFDMDCEPACRIKAGGERGLLMALRKAEQELADCVATIANEGTEAAKFYYAQMTRHNAQLMEAEQAGYDKGIADGSAEAARLREALTDVCNPLGYLQRHAEAEGRQLGGRAYDIAHDLNFVRKIAKDALATILKE